jgi:hypothetical protein
MGVPSSEVGYTSATAGRGDQVQKKGHVMALGGKIYRTIILTGGLYGCETWSLILVLREERRLMVFENRVLMRVFAPKRDEVKGEWRTVHHNELNNLYSSTRSILTMKNLCDSITHSNAPSQTKRIVCYDVSFHLTTN